jgi:hypothetical protein
VGRRERQKTDQEVEMFRRTAVVLAAAIAWIAVPGTGQAGGMAWFKFDQPYYLAGDRAVGQTVFWIPRKDVKLLDRTFYAYLIPKRRWIEPPRIPAGAIPLGPISLGGLARVSFTVPEVAPGGYTVGICDRPCRHSYVGDLGGGWITVVSSREEARLLPVIDRVQARLDRIHWNARQKAQKNLRRDTALRSEVAELEESLARAREELGARLVAVEGQSQPASDAFDRAGWAVAVVAIAALAFVSTRRRKRPEVPAGAPHGPSVALDAQDLHWKTEAAELEEREPVGVR